MRYSIVCRECEFSILVYNKRSPGALIKLYLKRIETTEVEINGKFLKCRCGNLIGVNKKGAYFSLIKASFFRNKLKV